MYKNFKAGVGGSWQGWRGAVAGTDAPFAINLLEFSFEYGIKILFKRAGKCLKYAKFAEKDLFSVKASVIPTKPPRKNGGPTCSR